MVKGRLEAFSDGVIAIVITIMVLELKIPHESDLAALRPLIPIFLSYVLSFVHLSIYWNNHHHLFQAVRQVNGSTQPTSKWFNAVAIPLAFATPWLACALYVLVAVLWLIPDRRIEKTLNS